MSLCSAANIPNSADILISKICGPAASSTLINNSPITTTNTLHNELGTIPIVPVSVPVVTAPSTNTTPVATVQNIRVLGAPQTPSAIVASPISSQPSNMEELLKRLNAKGGDPKKEKKENKEGDQSVRQSVLSGPQDSGLKSSNGGMNVVWSHWTGWIVYGRHIYDICPSEYTLSAVTISKCDRIWF